MTLIDRLAELMSVPATAASPDVRNKVLRWLPAAVFAMLLTFVGGWTAARTVVTSETANAVVGLVNMDGDRVVGVCLKDSPLGPEDGAGTCGALFLADGVVSNPIDLVDMTVKITVLSDEERNGTPVFLVEAAK